MFRWGWQAYMLWSARRNGRIDGERQLPEDEAQEAPHYIDLLCQRGQRSAERVAQSWVRQDAALQGRYLRAASSLQEAGARQPDAERQEEEAFLRYERLRREAEVEHQRLNPSGHWYISPFWYRVSVLLLAVGDLPLTAFGFQALGLSTFFTQVVAGLVVVLLASLGHFAGHYARQLGWKEGALLAAVGVVAAFFIGSVTYLREVSLQAVAAEVESVDTVGATLVFAAVTLLGFMVPALLAFHCLKLPLASKVQRARRDWERACRECDRLRRRLARARALLRQIAIMRQGARDAAVQEFYLIRAGLKEAMAAYCAANVRTREGNGTPPALRLLPQVEMPLALARGLEREGPGDWPDPDDTPSAGGRAMRMSL